MSKGIFGGNIPPACKYCARGCPARDGGLVLCERRGPVEPDFKCRHYAYDPLLRVPKAPLRIRHYKDGEFSL